MRKILMVLSVIASTFGLKALASSIDIESNVIIRDLKTSGLTMDEIEKLDILSKFDSHAFQKAVEQDVRIKGKLKIEVLATANKGGGPCVQGGQE